MSRKALDYDQINENVKKAQYAVRGELYLRASELQKEGKKSNDVAFIQYNKRLERRYKSLRDNKSSNPIFLRDVEENDDWVVPTEVELQEFVDARDGLLWSDVREAMGGNEQVGPSTRSKRERYRDDDDDDLVGDVGEEEEDLEANINEEVHVLDDVDSDAEPVTCN